jgi:hypothetical protein
VQQIDRMVSTLGNANDPLPGQSVASGTGAPQYQGQVGARVCLGNDDPLITRSASPTLFGGIYQYVQFKATSTAVGLVGLIAFWSTDTTYIVVCDEPTGVSDIAGICLTTVTKGNYSWIQIAGKATVQFRATTTKTTPAIGDLVLAAAAGAGADVATADVIADATSLTSVQARHILGIAIAAPVGGAASTVRLNIGRVNF